MSGVSLAGWLLIALAGALGAVLRWALGRAVEVRRQRTEPGSDFPYAILAANTLACLVAGAASARSGQWGVTTSLIVISGLCGGLSTLSTLAVDTVALWQRARHDLAVLNIGASFALGGLACAVGHLIATVR